MLRVSLGRELLDLATRVVEVEPRIEVASGLDAIDLGDRLVELLAPVVEVLPQPRLVVPAGLREAAEQPVEPRDLLGRGLRREAVRRALLEGAGGERVVDQRAAHRLVGPKPL